MSKSADPRRRSITQIWEKLADFKRGEFYDHTTFRFTSAGLNVAVLAKVGGLLMYLDSLYRYPVKGLSPEPLMSVELIESAYFPGDRLFALENGPSGFDPEAPVHQPKIKFLMLMKNDALAKLKSHYEDSTGILTIKQDERIGVQACLFERSGRARIEAYLTDYARNELRGAIRLLTAPEGFRFTDSKSGFISLVNLSSVKSLGQALETFVDPLRFRANIYIDKAAPWSELEWPGRQMRLGEARLEILKMTDRCAATGVEPGTGIRDMDIVQALYKNFGHKDCGVYARIISGGRVAPGDTLEFL